MLTRKDIWACICNYGEKEQKHQWQQKLLSGILRLCFGSINDVIKLVLRQEELADSEIDRLDLFSISELKKQKDGGFEIKFFNRLQALEKLEQIAEKKEQADGAGEFYQLLKSGAAMWQEEEEASTQEEAPHETV